MKNVGFSAKSCHFEMEFSGISSLRKYEDYEGSCDVTPTITSQRLETADKHMLDDVLIRAIPTKEIDNDAGGTTFIIGDV